MGTKGEVGIQRIDAQEQEYTEEEHTTPINHHSHRSDFSGRAFLVVVVPQVVCDGVVEVL